MARIMTVGELKWDQSRVMEKSNGGSAGASWTNAPIAHHGMLLYRLSLAGATTFFPRWALTTGPKSILFMNAKCQAKKTRLC